MISFSEGSTAQKTVLVVDEIEQYLLTEETETVESVFAAMGFGFATTLEEQGKYLIAATLEAATLRLRPIQMTSLAFMLGVVPLAKATGAGAGAGAGAAAQNSVGIGVLGGKFFSTFIGVFIVHSFYVIVRKVRGTTARLEHKLRAK